MFIITKATENDIETISSIGAQTFTDAYAANNTKEDLEEYISKSFSKAKIEEELNNPNTGYYLCYDDITAIGYSKLNFNTPCEAFAGDNVTELQRIYVLKEYYNKKAGKELMHHALALCKALAYDYLWLGVWKENHRALKFYASWGFETIGERGFMVGSKGYEDYYLRKKIGGASRKS
jgi:ribosomal protein S18 acetylase RimI-like enzyme